MAIIRHTWTVRTQSGKLGDQEVVATSVRNNRVSIHRQYTYPTLTPQNEWIGLLGRLISRMFEFMPAIALVAFRDYNQSFNAEHQPRNRPETRWNNQALKVWGSLYGSLANANRLYFGSFDSFWDSFTDKIHDHEASINNMIASRYLRSVRRVKPSFDYAFSPYMGTSDPTDDPVMSSIIIRMRELIDTVRISRDQTTLTEANITKVEQMILKKMPKEAQEKTSAQQLREMAIETLEYYNPHLLTHKKGHKPQDKLDRQMEIERIERGESAAKANQPGAVEDIPPAEHGIGLQEGAPLETNKKPRGGRKLEE